MNPKTYSLSGLSTETGVDRRTLAKRLSAVPAAEERDIGNDRTERRWRLADVLPYLTSKAPAPITVDREDANRDLIEQASALAVIPWLCQDHHPWLFAIYAGADLGLTREQTAHMYLMTMGGIVYSAAEGCREPSEFEAKVKDGCLLDTAMKAKQAGTLAEWADANWINTEPRPAPTWTRPQ